VFKVSVAQLWSTRRRLVGTMFAIVLGVAFLSGTLVLGDTLQSNFDSLFTQASRGTDAVVRSASGVSKDAGSPDATRGLIDQSIIERVRGVDGVAAAAGSVQGFGRLLDHDGNGIGGNGPPTFAGNWVTDPGLNPYHLVAGRAPRADDEVVINRGAANAGGLHLGDVTTVELPQPVKVRIVGLSAFGSSDGLGAVTFTAFTLPAAERLVTKRPGEVSSIAVRAEPGVSQTQLVRDLRTELPRGVEAITGAKLVSESTSDIDATFLDFLRTFLLVFAGVALLVATFSIYNTFAIIVAQRTRESALLRAIGATARQVLVAVVFEAFVLGALASAIGLFAGVGIAGLLKGLFDAVGFSLPAGGIVFTQTTVLVAMGVGIGVTLLASVSPAVRAARVPPLAALRDVSVDRSNRSRVRAVVGGLLVAAGLTVSLLAAIANSGGGVFTEGAIGALCTIAGVVVCGPVVVRPVCRILGAPVARLRGVSGALARRNAMRNPRRTASTASALMIGVCVVTLFTVFAASLKASIDHSVSASFRGDLVVTPGGFGRGGFSPELAQQLDALPAVGTAVGTGSGSVRVAGDTHTVTVADPVPLARVVHLDVQSGSLRGLGASSLAISSSTADDHGWRVGSVVPARFSDGATVPLRVGAVYGNDDVVGGYLLSRAAWQPHATQDIDSTVFVELRDGVSLERGKTAVRAVTASYGDPDVLDRAEYVDQSASRVNITLGIVYVLLALAIIIALMGIANTLSLAIHERRRELGLLRAVGQTRPQLRTMVRWESVLIATFGTVGGLALGVFLGWALVRAASSSGTLDRFAAPAGQLAVVLVVGALAGVLAGWRPARRAAKVDVLDAIAGE
jgi:putative ABC transport system permease protein